MAKHKIFLITPLGGRNSLDRCHADKMWNSVFKPLSNTDLCEGEQCEFVRSDLLAETGNSRVQEIMGLIRECRGCIVAEQQKKGEGISVNLPSVIKCCPHSRSDRISAQPT